MRFETQKINRLSDYFNIGFHKDVEEDYMFCIMFFGRDYVLRFFKKDSGWDPDALTEFDMEFYSE
jgi:hypothetical protein